MNRSKYKNLLSLAMMLGFIVPLSSCNNNGGNNTSNSDTSNVPDTQNPEKPEEEFGIHSKEEDDFLEYEDEVRPPRVPFEDNTPLDDGVLVDHTFEFEELKLQWAQPRDHYCGAGMYQYDPSFSGGIAIEALGNNATFILNLESDKAVKVPLEIRFALNYARGVSLSSAMAILNNNKKMVNLEVSTPTTGINAPYAPGGYFDMGVTKTTLSLVKGMNRITFHPYNAVNVDNLVIKTSANIKNVTECNQPPVNIDLIQAPTLNSQGKISISDNDRNCVRSKTLNIAPLSDDSYEKLEINGVETYHSVIGGKHLYVNSKLADIVDNPLIDDNETLKDNIFEIESAEVSGKSMKADGTRNDHFCVSDALLINPMFSGDTLLEDLDENNTINFTINSNKAVTVPFVLGTRSLSGRPLKDAIDMTNNDKASNVNLDFLSTSLPTYETHLGGISHKYQMGEAYGLIKLELGENKISITPKEIIDLDYLNIKTSATLTNNTVSTFKNIETTLVTKPDMQQEGQISVRCAHEGCSNVKTITLPSVKFKGYTKENDNFTMTVSITVLGKKIVVQTLEDIKYPVDEGNLVDHIFEFENAAYVSGNTRGRDHLCGAGMYVHPSLSGAIALDSLEAGTTFQFTIRSDKALTVPFKINVSHTSVNNRLTSDVFEISNNGKTNMADLNFNNNGQIKLLPNVPDYRWLYFEMMDANGFISLDKGINIINIKLKARELNVDYFNIMTSATLTDETIPYFSGENTPNIAVTALATANAHGAGTITCNHANHKNNQKDPGVNNAVCLIPTTTKDNGYKVKQENGNNIYYIVCFGKEIICAKEKI